MHRQAWGQLGEGTAKGHDTTERGLTASINLGLKICLGPLGSAPQRARDRQLLRKPCNEA